MQNMFMGYYGCESGCCGYRFYVYDDRDELIDEQFEFIHPDTIEELVAVIKETYPNIPVRLDLCEVVTWC